MDKEYARLINLGDLSSLFQCKNGYLDESDCSWYHENWLFLRALGLVSNPFWHEEFYIGNLSNQKQTDVRLLVLGTADFSMPFVCEKAGIKNITVCDICQTPLNICRNVSDKYNYSWKTIRADIFDYEFEKYDYVVNDAFISRFPYSQKRIVFEKIHNALNHNGKYITTMRHGWNEGNPILASEKDKEDFVLRALTNASKCSFDIEKTKAGAKDYINKIISYPIKDVEMIKDLISDLFMIDSIESAFVSGECAPTEYYRIVFRKI